MLKSLLRTLNYTFENTPASTCGVIKKIPNKMSSGNSFSHNDFKVIFASRVFKL